MWPSLDDPSLTSETITTPPHTHNKPTKATERKMVGEFEQLGTIIESYPRRLTSQN